MSIRFNMSSKLGLGFGLVLILTVSVAAVGMHGLENIEKSVEKSGNVYLLETKMLETRRHEKNYIIRGQSEYLDRVEKLTGEMDALQTTRFIRKNKSLVRNPDIPIIALTAYSLESDRDKFLEAGMDEYVSKPFEVDSLLETIGRVMN